jgi:putative transcriptional regulator
MLSEISPLYYDRAQKIDLEGIAKLCVYFDCKVGDLLELASEPPAESE